MTVKRFSSEIFYALKLEIRNHTRANNGSEIDKFQDRFQGPRNVVLNLVSRGRCDTRDKSGGKLELSRTKMEVIGVICKERKG